MAKILIGNVKGPKGDEGPEGPQGPRGPLPRQYMHNKENAVTMRLSAH